MTPPSGNNFENREPSIEPQTLIDGYSLVENILITILGEDFSTQSDIDRGIQIARIMEENPDVISVRSIGSWIILESEGRSISIDLNMFWSGDGTEGVEEISYDEAAARYQESISSFQGSIVELEVLSGAINRALERNNDETWEVIDENDIITERPFAGKTLVEAVLIYRSSILDSSNKLRSLGQIDPERQPELIEARERLYDANEEYLLLILGIGENREELTHVIPKTQAECLQLIQSIVSRRTPQEVLEWMRDIHAQIDANNWQDGTVEQNYRYFSDTLNVLALEKIRADIFENEESGNYRNPQLLLDFAVLVSGRPAWNRESRLLMYDWGEYASPVDSRLWNPEIANQALIYAMDVENESENGENQSMISEIMQYLELSEPLLGENTPESIARSTFELIKSSVHNGEGTLSQLHENQFRDFIESLGYIEIYDKAQSSSLADSYSELSLKDMIALSALIRISNGIEEVTSQETHDLFPLILDEPYEAQTGEEVVEAREVWTLGGTRYHYRIRRSFVSFENFSEIAQNAGQDAVQHVGGELDRNFDDGFWERFAERVVPFANQFLYETEEERAEQFGISPDSIEYQIFTLYNDINGNGNAGEVSDNTQVVLRTAGYMLAMVAGSMILGGGIGLAINAARAAQGLVAISVATQGALMGASGSAVGYGLDAVVGDALGFYTPQEATIGLATDFTLGAGTGALSGPLAQALPNVPNSVIFATDLTMLGLVPEMYRLHLMQQSWHGNEIFIQGEDPILGEIDANNRRLLLNPSDEVWQAYTEDPISEGVSPYLREHRVTYDVFYMMGIEQLDIPIEFDRRFQRAISIYQLLTPRASLDIFYHGEREFSEVGRVRDYETHEEFLQAMYEATEKWIERQESRLEGVL